MEENVLKMLEKNDEEFKIGKDMFGGKKEFGKNEFDNRVLMLLIVLFVNMLSDELKEEKEDREEKEFSEFDEIVKLLSNILSYAAVDEDKFDFIKFKDDSLKYFLWYDKDKRSIWLVEGNKFLFDKNNEIENKFIVFKLEKVEKIKGNIEFVNDIKLIFKVKEEMEEYIRLLNELNFDIKNK